MPSPRGEYELTDAIRDLAHSGKKVKALELTGEWADVRDPEILGEAKFEIVGQALRLHRKSATEAVAYNRMIDLNAPVRLSPQKALRLFLLQFHGASRAKARAAEIHRANKPGKEPLASIHNSAP